jgi:FkbM family methyltransferase
MEKINFNLRWVDYSFDPAKNSKISNFNMFMESFPKGYWEAETFNVFEYVKNKDKAAIDIGAWIGPTAVWLSKNFSKLVAVEADNVALEALKANLEDSGCDNVTIVDKAIYSERSKVTFGSNQYVETYQKEGLGASTSQIKTGGFIDGDYAIDTITINDLSEYISFDEVGFVKLDIEGGEEHVLTDIIKLAEKYNWKLWISFHYTWWKNLDIKRFEGLFNNCKLAAYNSFDKTIPNTDIIKCISEDPFGSIYFEF